MVQQQQRQSNIISAEEDEDHSYHHIRLSQSENQLADVANVVAAEYYEKEETPTVQKSFDLLNASSDSAQDNRNEHGDAGGRYQLASQVELTSTTPEQFAMGCTLLQLCAIGNLPTVVNYIANTYPNINFRDYDRRTALHVAASEGHLPVVRYLVSHGAKINRSDRWGGSPLDDAHRHRHTDVARYLRAKGATTGSVNLTNNLISAAAAGDIVEVRLILESNDIPDPNEMDLSRSMKPSGGGALKRITSFGAGIIVKAPLDLSGSRKKGAVAPAGEAVGLDTSSGPKTNVAVDINKGDYDRRTALHLAASEGHIDVVKFLCERGANVNVQDRWGGRPLDDALAKGNEVVAEVLRKNGAKSASDDDTTAAAGRNGAVQSHFAKPITRNSSSANNLSEYESEDENLRVDFSELEMIERIGSGAFGEIYKCRWRGILVAAKCIKASKIQKEWLLKKQTSSNNRVRDRLEAMRQSEITDEEKEQALEDFRRETSIMRRLRHPNIVMMLAYSHTDEVEVMISEICRCSLLDIFKANNINNTQLPKRTQIVYAQQLAAGMNHLHKSRPPIIHRDLKPANLLIDFSGMLKIADFGLAKIRPNPEQNEVEAFQMTGETGSYRFMAPEVFRHEEYSETVDVYSYAMIFYYMLRSSPPWNNLSGVDAATKAAVDGERPIIPRDVDDRLSNLLKKCWDENPKARPGFDEIITSLKIYSHDVFKTDTDNPDWEKENGAKCMQGGCMVS